MPTVYGISNCDTVKKARKWLDARGVPYRFHDLRKDGVTVDMLHSWAMEAGWEKLLNRAGITWRRLPEADRADLTLEKAIRLMLANPTVIKRPVLDLGRRRHVGFKEAEYEQLFPVA